MNIQESHNILVDNMETEEYLKENLDKLNSNMFILAGNPKEIQHSHSNKIIKKQNSAKSSSKSTLNKEPQETNVSNMLQSLPHGSKKEKIEKIMRKLNNEYVKQIKETDKKARNRSELYQELSKYNKELNKIKRANRDEDLLKMQKENQAIEITLKELKNKDKSELKQKEEESKKLVEDLNVLFNEKRKEAAEKDEERKTAIEEIKQIKKDQEKEKNLIIELTKKKERLTEILEKLDKDVENFKNYKTFLDQVIESSNEVSSNNDFDKLKEKFENLIERMHEIQNDITEQENKIQKIKKEKAELMRKNDKQAQNQRLLFLEEETKRYFNENKLLEKDIEEVLKKNQKKDSDTHQIKLSINNLYNKVKKTNDFDMNVDDVRLCDKLSEINERIIDLVKIHKKLEN
jgi:hypothetical protein